MDVLPYVEMSFNVIGNTLPADHGYGLYSAIAHLCPELHQQDWLSIETIKGIPDERGKIYLTEKSRLRLRLPGDRVPLVYKMAGKPLKIGNYQIRLGIPQIFMLTPAHQLRSRLTVIKGFEEPQSFLEAAKRQLHQLEIEGKISIPNNFLGQPERKTIKIKRFTVVGFSLEVGNLNEEDSIKLQCEGLGGKRRMGCGVFIPYQEEV
ncbi:type I-MYXAN CRISPR-associated protein Cas6/Cmx6 [Laspinema sp. D1]|uniref:type I-MYXAN CRISPR-associated protein Cas6/Cmx6 n=1 Tax=Laspinema palackyanum TaxID=3231601 RepID=UPI003481616C|nr:type I-MYXAN CRISPR-associated protein Cas6/Cmx6 [Laspinema sp. D2b]